MIQNMGEIVEICLDFRLKRQKFFASGGGLRRRLRRAQNKLKTIFTKKHIHFLHLLGAGPRKIPDTFRLFLDISSTKGEGPDLILEPLPGGCGSATIS